MMKNKLILSYLLWLFVAILSVIYFMTEKETREVEAISESNDFNQIINQQLLDLIKVDMEYLVTSSGRNARDVAVLDKLNKNSSFLDSLNQNEKLDWTILSNTLDTAQKNQISQFEEILNYKNYSSTQIKVIHQNLLYQTYQYILRENRNRVGDFYQMFSRDISLTNLDSMIVLYEWHNQIFSQISVSPNLDQLKSYTNLFNFTKSDTVVFQVVTEFYNKQREKEIKRYKVIAKDKKGVKINSFFDYEEIE